MKSFKICLFTSLFTVCAFALVVFSCNKNEPTCTGVFCNNGGSCVDGSCKCPDGYGGRNCELLKCNASFCDFGKVCLNGECACPEGFDGPACATRSRDKFLGLWQVHEDGTLSASTQFSASISSDVINSYAIRIQNFQDHFSNVAATVKGDSIIIPQQSINSSTVIGKGVYTASVAGVPAKITFWFKVTDASSNTDDFGYDTGTPSVWSK